MPEVDTLLIAITAFAAVTGLAWPRFRGRQSRKDRLLQQLRQSKRYWGVTIRNGKCAAARRLAGSKFPLDEAPRLPVEGCRSLHCTCSYTGLVERRRRKRRSGLDRRLVVRFNALHPDRRLTGERRRRFYNRWGDQTG
jgi:hypothetical protein